MYIKLHFAVLYKLTLLIPYNGIGSMQAKSINEVLFNPGLSTVKETTVLFEGKYDGKENSFDTRISVL